MSRAVIFDLDGLLIDSEPWWRVAEMELFATVGIHLSEQDCIETTGTRIDALVAYRHGQRPWQGAPTQAELVTRIVDRVIELIGTSAEPKPGGARAVALCQQLNMRIAVASASPLRLIEAALDRLDLRRHFELVVSAEHERWGKPHPAVFLTTAERLGVPPQDCLVLEDSLRGVIAAKAAEMICIAVPEHADPRFVIADRVLASLEELDEAMLSGP